MTNVEQKTVALSEDTHKALSHLKIEKGYRTYEQTIVEEMNFGDFDYE